MVVWMLCTTITYFRLVYQVTGSVAIITIFIPHGLGVIKSVMKLRPFDYNVISDTSAECTTKK